MLSEREVGEIAGAVLKKAFSQRGYQHVQTTFEEDFDGVEIIRLRANFLSPVEDSRALLAANDDIRSKIAERGDRRFVYLSQTSPSAGVGTVEGDDEDEGEDGTGIALR